MNHTTSFRDTAFPSSVATAPIAHVAEAELRRDSEKVVAKERRGHVDAFEFIRAQYSEIKAIFDEFATTGSGCVRSRRVLIEELGEKLDNHLRLKEKLLLPLHRKVNDTVALQSVEEMALIRALLRRITRLDVTDKSLAPKMQLLDHLVMHHIGAEDARHLPNIRERQPLENFERLGMRMQEEHRKLQGLHERRLRLREHRRWLVGRQNTARQLFGRSLPLQADLSAVPSVKSVAL